MTALILILILFLMVYSYKNLVWKLGEKKYIDCVDGKKMYSQEYILNDIINKNDKIRRLTV